MSRGAWAVCLVGVIAAGVLSRVIDTGFAVFDKYLGDALYAVMVYVILRILWRASAAMVGMSAMAVMIAIELFQLTMIPAQMLTSEHEIVRICARLLGAEFSFIDLLAYGAGIGCVYLADSNRSGLR